MGDTVTATAAGGVNRRGDRGAGKWAVATLRGHTNDVDKGGSSRQGRGLGGRWAMGRGQKAWKGVDGVDADSVGGLKKVVEVGGGAGKWAVATLRGRTNVADRGKSSGQGGKGRGGQWAW
eukprot:scaffold14651_cov92-Amphora_coffeaeformis.AAC.1